MQRKLTPCPSCQRHVLVGEAACPFCREAMPSLSRRALGALTAVSMGLAVAGCPARPAAKYGMPPQPAPEPEPEGKSPEPAAPMYGMPAPPPETPPETKPAEPEQKRPEEPAAPMYGMPAPPD